MMKKGIWFLGCAVVVSGAWAVWQWRMQPSATAQADRFLQLMADGQIEQAYALSTPTFQLTASKGELLVKSQRLGLDRFVRADWQTCSYAQPTSAHLEGRAELADGAVIQIAMRLRHQDGGWKVDFLGKSRGDLTLPKQEQLEDLVTATMLELGSSIAAGDFARFRQKAARSLQLMNTEQELRDSFARIDYSFVKELRPLFSQPPFLDPQGGLNLIGSYDTSPSRMEFLMNYTYEEPDWRLTRLQINLVDVYEKQAEQFVQHLSLAQFDRAYALTSAEFREHADERTLREVADQLQLIQNAKPKWTSQDEHNELITLDGELPTRGGQSIRVQVGMVLEGDQWKVHYLR